MGHNYMEQPQLMNPHQNLLPQIPPPPQIPQQSRQQQHFEPMNQAGAYVQQQGTSAWSQQPVHQQPNTYVPVKGIREVPATATATSSSTLPSPPAPTPMAPISHKNILHLPDETAGPQSHNTTLNNALQEGAYDFSDSAIEGIGQAFTHALNASTPLSITQNSDDKEENNNDEKETDENENKSEENKE